MRKIDRIHQKNAVVFLVAVLMLTAATGCVGYKKHPPPPPAALPSITGGDRLQESLFKGDQAVLSNQELDRILTAKVTLADRHRLAVVRLTGRSALFQTIANLEAENSELFLKSLSAAPHFSQVRFMPALLIPERRTVPYLREAAARFQADLLLVYGTRLRTFQRDRLIGADEAKAESVVESVLLDVRTGIVIHSAHAAEGIMARKLPGDLNFAETVAKAETDAMGKALLKVAVSVVEFVNAAEK